MWQLTSTRSTTRGLHSGAGLVLLAILTGCAGSGSGSPVGRSARPSSIRPPASIRLVVIGDSIPYNSADDCPGCTGFVNRYAGALTTATGRPVDVQNLSQHNGLTLPGLLSELDSFKAQLSSADAIIIGIAHNSNELSADRPCGAPLDAQQMPDWTKMTSACAAASAARYRPQYDRLFTQVAAWRAGKPTILRTINRYDDVRGAPNVSLTAGQLARVGTFLRTWDAMLCASATRASFTCVDIHAAFNGPAGERPSGDLLGGDYTHPSESGNALIARTLIAAGFAPLA